MAKFRITSPDGKKYVIEAPEDATQDELIARAQEFEAASVLPRGGIAGGGMSLDTLRSAGRAAGEMATDAGQFVAQEGKYSPVIDPDTGKPFKEYGSSDTGEYAVGDVDLGFARLLERNPVKFAQIIAKRRPGTKVRRTKGGDIIIQRPDGEKFILNQRGLSGMDASDIVSDVTSFIAGGALAAGKTVFGTALRTAGLVGGADLASDAGSRIMGSDREVDPVKSAVTGVAAGMVAGLSHAAINAIKRLANGGKLVSGGEFTPAARRILQKEGVPMQDLGADDIRAVNALVSKKRPAAEIVREARARAAGVSLTRGQREMDPKRLGAEYSVKTGQTPGRVESADQARLRAFLEKQDLDFAGTGSRVSTQTTGGPIDEAAGDAANIWLKKLSGLRDTARDAAKASFTAADEAGASLNKKGLAILTRQLRQKVYGKYGRKITQSEKAVGLVDEFTKLLKGKRSGPVPLNVLDEIRKSISALSRSADSVDAQAGRALRNVYMNFMEKQSPRFIIGPSGKSAEAGRLYNKAVTDYKAYAKDYMPKGDRKFTQILQKSDEGDGPRLTGEAAADVLMSKSGKWSRDAKETVLRIRRLLGADSSEWQAFRREFIGRAFTRAKDRTPLGTDALAGSVGPFKGEMAKVLFTPAELARLRNPGALAAAIKPPPGVRAMSGTAGGMLRNTADVLDQVPMAQGAMRLGRKFIYDSDLAGRVGADAASRAAIAPITARGALPPAVAGAVTSSAAQLTEDQKQALIRALAAQNPF